MKILLLLLLKVLFTMLLFLVGVVILIVGYFTYGKFVERVLGVDDRETPAIKLRDDVDFMVLPKWKNILIHLLNIAGISAVIGVIMGIKFGKIVFIIIPIVNILAGAVHDFVTGVMSVRTQGANLPELIRLHFGKHIYVLFSIFVVVFLVLVVAVFINIPASLLTAVFNEPSYFWIIAGLIFLYYILATLFPIDKIIGTLYPLFGAILLISSLLLFGMLIFKGFQNPSMFEETQNFLAIKNNSPIIPVLFVTIACGIISGGHATQVPIIARTIGSERHARATFYGMMIAEGIIAMIWAAAAMAVYNMEPDASTMSATKVLYEVTRFFFDKSIGILTIVCVVILAVTSGDTIMRSARISLAEIFKVDQKRVLPRIGLTFIAIFLVIILLIWSNMNPASFGKIWNYFAWGNQILATFALWAGTSWLISLGKNFWITLIPGLFMNFIVTSYILWVSPAKGGPMGFGLDLYLSYAIAAAFSIFIAIVVTRKGRALQKQH